MATQIEISDRAEAYGEYVIFQREKGITYQRIADRIGVTRERARQVKNRRMRYRIRELSALIRKPGLVEYLRQIAV